ncbi:B3 domain-containing transcription factor VRN1-like isoform X1 [Trifolium pratense]|uniref:B3 domain-containing transcription factor VRN1-like isoform X1 n=1 Tax=Trifolium pratense TaxID=57577 RepID=UPI001E693379|nr:B3 domain-containing transcription factor VRN1-like isoform X1 [Trifolium pratense]
MSNYCPKEFFKIVQNHELHNGELRLPKKFVKNHWKEISNPVVLKLPNNDRHKISWVKRDGDIWLQKNWENIAKFLKLGFVVVFKYKGRSYFKVKIFGLNTLEIDYSNITKFIDESCEVIVDDSDDDDSVGQMNGVGTSQRGKTRKRKMNGSKRGRKAKKSSTSGAGAVNVNPSFEVKLSKTYALPDGYMLRLPSDFSQKYLNGYYGSASIRVGEDMAMEVTLRFQDIDYNRTSFISDGWKPVIQKYNLQVDDRCEFKMIQQHPPSFTLTINEAGGMISSCDNNIGKRRAIEGTSRSYHVQSNLEGHIIEICVSSNYPYIDSEVFDRHREWHNKDVQLKMGQKSWFVTVKYYGKTCKFYKGWRPFKKDCNLKNGDSCFLKLIDEENLLFEVSFE